MLRRTLPVVVAVLLVVAAAGPAAAVPEGPPFPSPEWTAREKANLARAHSPDATVNTPEFQARLQAQSEANVASYQARQAADPTWTSDRNLAHSYDGLWAGNPSLYPGVDPFYDNEGDVRPVVFYDRGCARISGRVWAPRWAGPGDRLPGVVIVTGSIQAPETWYWWFAESLVRSGYQVLTFDVRGQGRSDWATPTGERGSNANPAVFWDGTVDAIDFLHSSPSKPYPWDITCAGTYPTTTDRANPLADRLDPDRLGIVGHSLGAFGVSVVQGLDPWPGRLDAANPVDAVVAWDRLASPGPRAGPDWLPRVPALSLTADYGITPVERTSPPDPDAKNGPLAAWTEADLPIDLVTIQGGTHEEFTNAPGLPASAPEWGNELAGHYSLAWLDRWVKEPGERGRLTADARLLDDATYAPRMSFYYRSARRFPDRLGIVHESHDVRSDFQADPGGARLERRILKAVLRVLHHLFGKRLDI